MKRIYIIIFILFLISGCSEYWSPTNPDHIIKTDPWTEIASMPTARQGLTASLVNNKIYCIGGEVYNKNNSSWSLLNVVEVYDPMTDSWESLTPMPHSRGYHGSAVVNDKIYIIGGWSYTNSSEVLVFDPNNQSWTTMAGSNVWRAVCAVSVFDNKIYIFGGRTNNNIYINLVEEFNPQTGQFIQKTSMPTGRMLCSATTLNDKIFVIGGRYASGYSQDYSKVEVYDPKRDSWQTFKNANTGMPDDGTLDPEGIVTLENKIHILGEFCHFEYDPITQNTVEKSNKNLYTAQCGYEVFNSKIYNFGGIRFDYYNSKNILTFNNCYVYDPNKDEWK